MSDSEGRTERRLERLREAFGVDLGHECCGTSGVSSNGSNSEQQAKKVATVCVELASR